MTDNMSVYNKGKEVPENAQRTITGGRLSGMTDINPQWRIEKLTEMFGPCGIGWKVKTVNRWIEEGSNGEKVAFLELELFIKVDGEWSDSIEGSGGASFISKEKNGLYTSDECYKMAKTDALSVACKMLGIGSDIYRGYNDSSKYGNNNSGKTGNKTNKNKTGNSTGNTSKPKEQTADEKTQISTLKNILYLAAEKDIDKMAKLLEQNTSFKGRDGKQVKGLTNFNELVGRRLEVTLSKIEKLYPDIVKLVNEKKKGTNEKK